MIFKLANLQRMPTALRGSRLLSLCAAGILILAGCATKPDSLSPTAKVPARTNASFAAVSMTQTNEPVFPLTVEAAIQRAVSSSPRIKALRAAAAVAKQRKAAASDFPDPEGIASWGNFDDDLSTSSSNDKNERRYGGRFYLPNPFLIVPRVNARAADFQAALADLQAARWLAENDVRRLFSEIQYLSDDLVMATELSRQNGLILSDARARAGQGAATVSDVVTAVEHSLKAQHDMDDTRYRRQIALRELATLVDLDTVSLRLATNAPSISPLPDLAITAEPLERSAFIYREDIVALHWRTLAAQSAYHEARNVNIPWVKDVSAVHRDPESEWWFGISVNVPIFSWTINKADTVQLAEAKLAEVNESNGTQVMRREIRDATEEFELQLAQQRRNQNEITPLIAEMRQTLETLKHTPSVMPSQVAETEAQIIDSSRLELGARWLYQAAQFNLERVLGTALVVALNPEEKKP